MKNEIRGIAKEIAGPNARIKRHGLFNPVYEVTTEPSLLSRTYQSMAEPVARGVITAGLILNLLSVGANTAIAEEAKNHFPFPQKLSAEVETEYKSVSGSDYSHFGFTLTEIGKDGMPLYGDFARVFLDRFADGTTRTNAGVMVPFNFGYKGALKLYGLEHKDDEGVGIRMSGCYNDWLLKGVLERAELGGDSQSLKGLGMGRVFHSGLGETTLEFWGYDKNDESFGNLFLFQRFGNGYLGGLSSTGGVKGEQDFSASFGRYDGEKSWRFHGGTALDGETFSFGASYILEPDPRHATTPFGYLNTDDGVKSYQELWRHAMGYYPTLRLFENGRFLLQADYFHDKDSEGVSTRASIRPFDLLDFDSDLLRRVFFDVKYNMRNPKINEYDNLLMGRAGIQLKNGMDFYIEKTEGESPVFFVQLRHNF